MKLELKHIQCYPIGEDVGILIQTCTRTHSKEGEYLGFKTGRLIGISSRTDIEILFGKDDFSVDYDLNEIKPILHPLSDITKEIEVQGKKFIPLDKLGEFLYNEEFENFDNLISAKMWIDLLMTVGILKLPFNLVEKLISWHFDIHNLIPEGLAIDRNTL